MWLFFYNKILVWILKYSKVFKTNLQAATWRTTFDGRQLLMENNLWRKRIIRLREDVLRLQYAIPPWGIFFTVYAIWNITECAVSLNNFTGCLFPFQTWINTQDLGMKWSTRKKTFYFWLLDKMVIDMVRIPPSPHRVDTNKHGTVQKVVVLFPRTVQS